MIPRKRQKVVCAYISYIFIVLRIGKVQTTPQKLALYRCTADAATYNSLLTMACLDRQNDENCESRHVKPVQKKLSQVEPGQAVSQSAQPSIVILCLEFT